MPKLTNTDRIYRHVLVYGLATPKEIQEKYDVSPQLISNILARAGGQLVKSPSFLTTLRGKYRLWTQTGTRLNEAHYLGEMLKTFRAAYTETHHEKYKTAYVQTARKFAALALDILVDAEMYVPPNKLPISPEGSAATEEADQLIIWMKDCFRTGSPRIPIIQAWETENKKA